MNDVRMAFRGLAHRPSLTVMAVCALGLGVGANTVLFSVVDAVLIRPLPYADPGRLYRVAEVNERTATRPWDPATVTGDTFAEWHDRGTTIARAAAWTPFALTLRAPAEPVRVQAALVTADMFATLGAPPALGRLFEPKDSPTNGIAPVVLSHRTWRTRFGADDRIVGRTIVINDRPYVVVGVTRPEFYFPTRDTELWTLFSLDRTIQLPGGTQGYTGLALVRLKHGVTAAAAAAEGSGIARAAAARPLMRKGADLPRLELKNLQESITGDLRPALFLLMGAVIAVLVLASSNVANLLLVRSIARRRELAIRAALGASAWRIGRELMTQSIMLGTAAAAGGLLFAWGMQAVLPALLPSTFPRSDEIALDTRVLSFGLAVSMAAAVLAGMAPVAHGARLHLVSALNLSPAAGAIGFGQRGAARVRGLLVGGEVALSCALLVIAALLSRSFANLTAVDPGYSTDRVLTAQLSFRPGTSDAEQQRIVSDVLTRIEASGAVQRAGVTDVLPLVPDAIIGSIAPKDGRRRPTSAPVHVRIVTPGYIEAMGLRVIEGRTFTAADAPGTPPVVMVNEAFVREYGYGVGDVIGRRSPPQTVIGILADVRASGQEKPAEPELYGSFGQSPVVFLDRIHLAIRTADRDPAAFIPTLRAIARDVNPEAPLYDVMTMEERLDRSVATPRFYALALATFSAIALLMAAVGLYGAVAYTVSQRRRELGIRMALGASAARTLTLVVRQTLVVIATGIAAGLVIAAAASSVVQALLFGIRALDAATMAGAAGGLLLVALVACVIPARQALRVDPASTLRAE